MSAVKMTKECPVCFEIYQNPKVLSCGHTFCEKCITSICDQAQQDQQARARKVRFSCPECRVVQLLPAGGVSDLPTNIALVRLTSDDGVAPAEQPSAGQTGLNDGAGPSGEPSITASLKRKAKYRLCPQHGEDLCYFCVTCSTVICMDCIVLPGQVDHINHTRTRLDSHTGEVAARLAGTLEMSKSRTTMLRNLYSAWVQAGQKGMENNMDVRGVLLRRKQAILDCVEGCHTQFLAKLEEEALSNKRLNAQALAALKESIEGLEGVQSRTEVMLQESHPCEVYENHDTYSKALSNISPQEQQMSSNTPSWNSVFLEDVDSQIFRDLVTAMFGSVKHKQEFVLPKPIFLTKFNTKSHGETQENNVWDVIITEDGLIAVADFTYGNIKLFNQAGELVKIMSKGRHEMTYTRISTLPGCPDYLLVLESTAALFKWHIPTNTVTKFFNSQQAAPPEFAHAVGITSHKSQPVVVLPHGGENKLRLFDYEGREVANHTIETGCCRYIASHAKQDYLVVHHYSGKLSAYRGEDTLWTKSMENGQIPVVCGLTMDSRGYILACHTYGNSVNVYLPNGDLNQTLLGVEDKMDSPQAIAYDHTHHLLVIAELQGNIKVYRW